MPFAVIQLDCLLTLLTNLVIYDELIVDQSFMETWDQEHPQLSRLTGDSLLRPIRFDPEAETLAAVRAEIVNKMAVTPSLKEAAEADRKSWELTGQSADPHMSALLWGGAGMLARSHILSAPYLGHPFRRTLIKESGVLAARRDAWARTENVVSAARMQMFRFRHSEIDGALASFNFPPIAVQVIEHATSVDDLLLSAIALRDRYSRLREWTIAPYLLPGVLPSLRRAHKELELFLREDLTERLLERLRAGSLDVALIALPFDTGDLYVHELFKDEFWFVSRNGVHGTRQEEVAIREVDAADVLLLEEGHCLRGHAIAACGPSPRCDGNESRSHEPDHADPDGRGRPGRDAAARDHAEGRHPQGNTAHRPPVLAPRAGTHPGAGRPEYISALSRRGSTRRFHYPATPAFGPERRATRP